MNLFQKYLIGEFAEEYEEGRLTRREALKLITSITGSLILANTILAACAPPPEEALPTRPANTDTVQVVTQPEQITPIPFTEAIEEPIQPSPIPSVTATEEPTRWAPAHGTVMPEDPTIEAYPVEFPSDPDSIQGYLARPRAEGSFPAVMICHENRGLTEHIRDVARRFAKVGFVSLAVDLLSRSGGTATLASSEVPGVLSSIDPDQFVQDFRSGWLYLSDQPFAQAERVGMIGFCLGGGVTWRVATQMPELRAAIPFDGPHPEVEDVPNIQAAIMAIYGERDQRINQGILAIEEAMLQSQITYEKVIYTGADHAFFNDTGSRYNPEAAQDAWGRVLEWFNKYLG
jgi:carboxymethylenebutenolidase